MSSPVDHYLAFNIRSPGQYFDEETGLHYNRFRYYDPSIGRYISADPIGQAGGTNVYNYALSNPVNLTDPFGLDVRLENTAAVNGLHQRVAVDTPGGFHGQSFGLRSRTSESDGSVDASFDGHTGPGFAGEGVVYPDDDPATKVQDTLKTTPTQDAAIARWLKPQLGDTGLYNPATNSCRDWSQDTFNEIRRKLKRGDFGK